MKGSKAGAKRENGGVGELLKSLPKMINQPSLPH